MKRTVLVALLVLAAPAYGDMPRLSEQQAVRAATEAVESQPAVKGGWVGVQAVKRVTRRLVHVHVYEASSDPEWVGGVEHTVFVYRTEKGKLRISSGLFGRY